jgi:pilus assembly protein CpaF
MKVEEIDTTSSSESTTAAGAATKDIKAALHRDVLGALNLVQARSMPADQLRAECLRKIDALLKEQGWPLSAPEKKQLLQEVMDEIFGFGPLEEVMRDTTISDILVNGAGRAYIERFGVLEQVEPIFRDDEHLLQVIQRIGARVGRRIDESSPMLDARLPDGSRVNAIIPPLAIDGPALSIRRFGATPITAEKLVDLGTWTEEMASFVQACVRCKMNILVSGGTGSGKTTLLNVLSRWIPSNERVVTIEDSAELQLQREHVVRLEARPPNIEGKGEVSERDLVRNSLRMRPDRIIVGEVRGPEALDMLQAMNTGHEGSMSTVHANQPRDALRRLENMVAMTGLNYPIRAMREQMASSLNLLVHLTRVTGGRRKMDRIVEITGIEGDAVCLQDLFQYRQLGLSSDGHAQGHFEACGVRPLLMDRLTAEGIEFPKGMFQQRKLVSGASGKEGNA